MDKIRLLLADDQSMIREGLKSMLSTYDDIEIVAEAENGQQAIDLCSKLKPHILLTDIRMPVLNGVEATRVIKNNQPGIIVIVLTTFDDDDYIFDAMTSGAAGYLLKNISSSQLVQALRDSMKGNLILPGPIASKITARLTSAAGSGAPGKGVPGTETATLGSTRATVSHSTESDLKQSGISNLEAEDFSNRERDIIRLLVKGSSNKEIAEALFLTTGTVKNYISQIYLKLGVSDRANAIIALNNLGIG